MTQSHKLDYLSELGLISKDREKLLYKLLEVTGNDFSKAGRMLKNPQGIYNNEIDFAMNYSDDFDIHEKLAPYIMHKNLAKDLLNGEFISVKLDGKLHVFLRDE